MMAQDDSTAELDGGAGHKKPPRKARKKLLSSQDSILLHFCSVPPLCEVDCFFCRSSVAGVGTLEHHVVLIAMFGVACVSNRVYLNLYCLVCDDTHL